MAFHQNEAPVPDTPGPVNTCAIRGDRSSECNSPLYVAQARAALIREALADDLDRIATFAEHGLIAIDSGNDHDLGRAFDQATKLFVSAAGNIRELIAVLDGGAP